MMMMVIEYGLEMRLKNRKDMGMTLEENNGFKTPIYVL